MKLSYNQNRIKIIFILSLVTFFALYSLPCSANQRLSVVTSIFPLQEFALAVGGDRVKVDLLLTAGAEPHTWEPKPSDLVTLSQADIFLYLGAGMEPWVDDLIKGINRPSLQVIEISKGIWTQDSKAGKEHKKWEISDHQPEGHKPDKIKTHLHEKNHKANHKADKIKIPLPEKNHHKKEILHSHGHVDPHIWLDFHYDQIIVGQIAEFFAGQDPEGKDYYHQNALRYQKKLKALDQKYQQGLKNCRHGKFFWLGILLLATWLKDTI